MATTPRKRTAAPVRSPRATPARATRASREVEPEPVEEVSAAGAQEIEAQADDAGVFYVTAALCGEPVRVIPPSGWRLSWNRMMLNGQLDTLLEIVLHPEDLAFVIDELDPKGEELNQFLNDAGSLAGEPMGKSNGRRASSRSTRKR